ncbi:MAG: hypothetical protein N2Z22_01815 [Turneriella sp.]|nr:hypothetical protein [Turneriella sp.]
MAKPPQPAQSALRDTTSAIATLISALQQEAKQNEIAMLEQLDARYRHFLVAVGALRKSGSVAPAATTPDPKKNIPNLAENAPKKSPAPTKGGRQP